LFWLKINADDSIEATLTTYNNQETKVLSKVCASPDLREDIDDGITDIKQGKLEGRQKDIRRLGRNLYRAIFPDQIGGLFEYALQSVQDDRNRGDKERWLRVVIEVNQKSAVFRWPLEFLYCPSKRQWLATARPFLALSRHITHGGTIDLNRERPPLRVLVVI